jgi:hypothetical protein
MNKSFHYTYGFIKYGTILFFSIEKYSKKFFVLPASPSNELSSSDHHNSYNKGPMLAFFSFLESPSTSVLTIKYPKNRIAFSYHSKQPKSAKAISWHHRILPVPLCNWQLELYFWSVFLYSMLTAL